MDARRARPRGGLLFGDFLLATQEKVTRAPGRRAEKDRDVEFQTEVVTVTSLPAPAKKKLGLVIDLDTCVGCHACAVACKEWNDGGDFGPLADDDPYGAEPHGVWFNRVHSYEVTGLGTRNSGFEQHAASNPDLDDFPFAQSGNAEQSS